MCWRNLFFCSKMELEKQTKELNFQDSGRDVCSRGTPRGARPACGQGCSCRALAAGLPNALAKDAEAHYQPALVHRLALHRQLHGAQRLRVSACRVTARCSAKPPRLQFRSTCVHPDCMPGRGAWRCGAGSRARGRVSALTCGTGAGFLGAADRADGAGLEARALACVPPPF